MQQGCKHRETKAQQDKDKNSVNAISTFMILKRN